jgi:O-antigen/teichoic acid export membrane protein
MEILRKKTYDTLRWSEKYFKTDMIYLTKGSFWLFILQFVSAGASFVLSIVFARMLTKETFGIYKYILSVAGILSAFTLTGLSTAVTQAIANGKDGILRWAYKINYKWSIGFVALSLSGALYYFFNSNTTLSISLLFIAILVPVANSSSLYSSYYSAKKKFKEFGAVGSIRVIIPVVALISTAFLSNNPVVIVLVYLVVDSVTAHIIYSITLRRERITAGIPNAETLSYSKHLSLMSIIGIIADNLDKVIIFQHIGSAELAIYTFATALPTQIKGVLKNVYTLAFPKFAVKEIKIIKQVLPGAMLRFTLVTVPIVIMYIFAAPYIFKIFFPQYIDAVIYSQVFAVSLFFYSSILVSAVMQSRNMVSALYRTNIFSSIGRIGLILALTYSFGLWGVVLARVLYELYSLIISSWSLYREV